MKGCERLSRLNKRTVKRAHLSYKRVRHPTSMGGNAMRCWPQAADWNQELKATANRSYVGSYTTEEAPCGQGGKDSVGQMVVETGRGWGKHRESPCVRGSCGKEHYREGPATEGDEEGQQTRYRCGSLGLRRQESSHQQNFKSRNCKLRKHSRAKVLES